MLIGSAEAEDPAVGLVARGRGTFTSRRLAGEVATRCAGALRVGSVESPLVDGAGSGSVGGGGAVMGTTAAATFGALGATLGALATPAPSALLHACHPRARPVTNRATAIKVRVATFALRRGRGAGPVAEVPLNVSGRTA